MSTPLSAPNAQAITDALSQIGVSGSGATADQWRTQVDANTSIAAHLQTIAAAVTAAKQRASDALKDYTAAAPTAAEIDAAQQELLAASQSDDTRHPDRLKKAEDKLGELLARKQRAEDKLGQDSQDNADQLAADRKTADGELSPEARAKLQQLLGSLAGMPASAVGGGAPAAAPAGGAPAATGGRPGSGFSPSSSITDNSDMGPVGSSGGGEEPGLTHTTTDLGAVASAPTLTNATSASPMGAEATPVATAGPQSAAGQSPAAGGGFMPPMAPGMGMGGAGRNQGAAREGEGRTGSKLDRDEVLNGDDLLSRSVKGRL